VPTQIPKECYYYSVRSPNLQDWHQFNITV